MEEQNRAGDLADHDLFLIEVEDGGQVRYLVAERFLTIEPGGDALGVSWTALAALFRERTLRAVPMPGRRHPGRLERMANSSDPGFCTGATNVEVNLVKIGKGG